MRQFDGDITDVTAGIICHTADNRGLMMEKISQHIRDKWPLVKSEYLSMYIDHDLELGEVIFTNVDPNSFNLQVATMVCENNFVTKINGQEDSRLDYEALRRCAKKVRIWQESCADGKLPIYIPHGLGCSNMKGDWRLVRTIFESKLPNILIIRGSKF